MRGVFKLPILLLLYIRELLHNFLILALAIPLLILLSAVRFLNARSTAFAGLYFNPAGCREEQVSASPKSWWSG